MIQSGGWNRLRTTDEHSKLARDRTGHSGRRSRICSRSTLRRCGSLSPKRYCPDWALWPPASSPQGGLSNRLRLLPGDATSIRSGAGVSSYGTGGWHESLWPLITEILARELREHPDPGPCTGVACQRKAARAVQNSSRPSRGGWSAQPRSRADSPAAVPSSTAQVSGGCYVGVERGVVEGARGPVDGLGKVGA